MNQQVTLGRTHFPAPVEDLLCRLTRNLIHNPCHAQRQRLERLVNHALRLAGA